MSGNVRELIEQSQAFYEVLPYYILLDERPVGTAARTRRIQAGFDIDVYSLKNSHGPGPSAENLLVSEMLPRAAEITLRRSSDCCSIEIDPLGSDTFFMPDNRRQLQPWTELRIRITHARGLDEPAGPSEECALKEIQKQLQSLGIKQGKGR